MSEARSSVASGEGRMRSEEKPSGTVGLLFDIGIAEQIDPNETLAIKDVLTKFYQDFTQRHPDDQAPVIKVVELTGTWHTHEGKPFLAFGLNLVAVANRQTLWEQSWSLDPDQHNPESQTLHFRVHGECKIYLELDVFPPLFLVSGKDEEFSVPAPSFKEAARVALEKVEQLSPQFAGECESAARAAEERLQAGQNPTPDRKLN